jgi:hypothetical protein
VNEYLLFNTNFSSILAIFRDVSLKYKREVEEKKESYFAYEVSNMTHTIISEIKK